jgi:glycosyltransferase involved in cell wall biosynthesis
VVTGAVDGEQLARAARRPGADTTGGPRVSVIVTVLNEGPALGRLVDDLLPQLSDGDELVLVDGGSTDGSVEALGTHPALQIEVVPGAGISAGRNHGIRVAGNELMVCTDAGCTPDPGFVEGFRRAFAVADPPALVSGVYTASARTAMERAQALACYPQPREVRRPGLFVRSYTRLFGTGFDPRFAVGRCVAFTREAWQAAGGFPEHLATGEDVSFGLAVSRYGRCEATTDAVVDWAQRDGLAATWRMYRSYGRASTAGGNRALLVRDGVRGLAYVAAPLLATRPAGRAAVALGAAAYLSLPVARAARAGAGPRATALLPVALAVKDLGKLAGAVQGLLRGPR